MEGGMRNRSPKRASKIFGICAVMVPLSLLTTTAIVLRTSGSLAEAT